MRGILRNQLFILSALKKLNEQYNKQVSPVIEKRLASHSEALSLTSSLNRPNKFKSEVKPSASLAKTAERMIVIPDVKEIPPTENTLVIVTGASGFLAEEIIKEFRQDLPEGSKIIGLTRPTKDPEKIQKLEEENRQTGELFQKVTCDYTNEGIRKVLNEEAKGKYTKIIFVNTVGGAHFDPASSYEQLNVTPVKNLCDALTGFQRENPGIKSSLVHLSSHTTALLPDGLDPYVSSRYKAERLIEQSGLPYTTFRLGVITNEPVIKTDEKGKTAVYFDTLYEYSPERNATLPYIPSLGHHQLPLQWTDSGDVARAVRNASYSGQLNKRINTASCDMATQDDINATLKGLQGKEYRPFFLPLPLVATFVNFTGGHGRLTPYAASWSAAQLAHESMGAKLFMDPQPFIDVLGRKPKEFQDVFNKEKFEGITTVQFPRTDITKNLLDLAKRCLNEPEVRQDVFDSIQKHGGVVRLLTDTSIAAKELLVAKVSPAVKEPGTDLCDPDSRKGIVNERLANSFVDQVKTINDPRLLPMIEQNQGVVIPDQRAGRHIARVCAEGQAAKDKKLFTEMLQEQKEFLRSTSSPSF